MIQLLDKYFEAFIPVEEVEDRIAVIASEINSDYQGKEIYIVVVLSGALRFGAQLMSALKVPVQIVFTKFSSYSGTEQNAEIKTELALADLEGKNVLIVEDIIDTGSTLSHILNLPQLRNAVSVKTASLLSKPDARMFNVSADYLGFTIPDKFVVGYGLDYKGWGRNLNGIYQLKEN